MKRLVMFDFDGVIADSWCGQKPVFVDVLREHGMHHLATSAVFSDLMDANWFEGLSTAGVPEHLIRQMDETWGAQTPELFVGMPEVIERLAEAHVVLVITSAGTEDVRRVLREWEVGGVTEVVGGDLEPSKVRKIQAARERYGESLEPWYVCDTVGDVVEAKAAGAAVVGAAWGWHGEERLLGSGPDRIAKHPYDLLDLL
jgi:phosphoglycolate phosphatase